MHVMAALSRALIERAHRVVHLGGKVGGKAARAKAQLAPRTRLKHLDKFDCIALMNRYVQHDRAEMEVLFTLLAERYEPKAS